MPKIESVLIVGGGIAGPTLARALQREGLTVELIERSAEWRAEGGGIAVQPNGMRALRALGLDGAVERSGQRLRRWSFCDQAGEILSENDLEALWGDVGPFIGIERTRLQRILVAGLIGKRPAFRRTGSTRWCGPSPISSSSGWRAKGSTSCIASEPPRRPPKRQSASGSRHRCRSRDRGSGSR